MQTPLQKLMATFSNPKGAVPTGMWYDKIRELMLEEKQMIKDAYLAGIEDYYKTVEDYYNANFKPKNKV